MTSPATTPAAVPPAPAADRAAAVDVLRQSRDAFIAALGAIPADAWERRPAPDRWCAAEIAEHVIRLERQMRRFLPATLAAAPPDPARRGALAGRDAAVLSVLRDRSRALTAPPQVAPEGGRYPAPAPAIADFAEARAAVLAFAESTDADLRAAYVPHPRLGDIDGQQWLLFIAGHTDRHTAQLEELRAQLGAA